MNLPFDLSTFHDRLQRVRQSIEAETLDGLILTLPHSIYWLTGFDTTGFAWVVVDHANEPAFISRNTEEPGFGATSWLTAGRFYDPDDDLPSKLVAQVVSERGLNRGSLGIDLGSFGLLPSSWEDLKRHLPDATFVDATDLVPELKFVKTPAEIQYQMQAAQMADHALKRAVEALRPGITETQLQGVAELALGEAGSEYAATQPMITMGVRSAIVHGMATTGHAAARGDVVCIEIGAAVRRYHAIVMRSAVIGRPSERLLEVAACQREAIDAAIATIRPGVPVSAPERSANDALDRLGLVRYRCHRLGYSLGIGYPPVWVEPMLLARSDRHTFAPGMVFSVEPNLALPAEGFGLKLGDTVICMEAGARSMSELDHDLIQVS